MSKSVGMSVALWVALALGSLAARCQAAEWKKFTLEKGDFVVLMPSVPQEKLGSVRGKNDEHEFTVIVGNNAYSVIYIDFDASIGFVPPAQALDSFIQGGIKADRRNTVLGERPTAVKGYPARIVKYKSSQGYVARAKIVLVKQRLYQVTVVGTDKSVASPEADSFLNSFDLIGKYQPPAAEATWTRFAPANEGFAVLMPGAAQKEVDPPLDTKFGKVTGESFMAMAGTGIYGVSYGDYPPTVARAEAKQVLDAERDRITQDPHVKLVSEKDVPLGDVTGREIVLEMPQGMVSRARFFLVKQRLYQVTAVTPGTKQNDAAEQADVTKFLESFQLVPAPR